MDERKKSINEVKRVICPYCGYRMPLFYKKNANCSGVSIACKGRNCSAIFELKIVDGKQIK